MQTGKEISPRRPSVATIGFFDGVHCGHRYLIEQVREVAALRNMASTVVTFPVHPRQVMQSGFTPHLLNTYQEKIALLERTGIDYCTVLDFTPELALLSAHQFMVLLKEHYRIEALVVGYDHRFGHSRSEGFDHYVAHGNELGIEVLPARAYSYNEETMVSSSAIRQFLQKGQVEEAAAGLGYQYFLQGSVVNGYRVGRTIGYPTANLQVEDPHKLIPADGVYAVRVLLDGHEHGGMLSIGHRPTLDNGPHRSIEVHIFDFNADIYHCRMGLSFVKRTRSELKFDSIDELVARLRCDEDEVRAILASVSH